MLSTHRELAAKLDQLERKLQNHDQQIVALVQAIQRLMRQPDEPPKPPIGYDSENRERK